MVEGTEFRDRLLLRTPAETAAFGRRIADELMSGDTIALEGDLGAGKTTLARAILRALGVEGEVPSPSFTLVQEYETQRARVFHFDLYRIEKSAEIDELGLDEALSSGVVIVEWAERAPARIPPAALRLRFEIIGETERSVQCLGPARWARLLTHTKA